MLPGVVFVPLRAILPAADHPVLLQAFQGLLHPVAGPGRSGPVGLLCDGVQQGPQPEGLHSAPVLRVALPLPGEITRQALLPPFLLRMVGQGFYALQRCLAAWSEEEPAEQRSWAVGERLNLGPAVQPHLSWRSGRVHYEGPRRQPCPLFSGALLAGLRLVGVDVGANQQYADPPHRRSDGVLLGAVVSTPPPRPTLLALHAPALQQVGHCACNLLVWIPGMANPEVREDVQDIGI